MKNKIPFVIVQDSGLELAYAQNNSDLFALLNRSGTESSKFFISTKRADTDKLDKLPEWKVVQNFQQHIKRFEVNLPAEKIIQQLKDAYPNHEVYKHP